MDEVANSTSLSSIAVFISKYVATVEIKELIDREDFFTWVKV